MHGGDIYHNQIKIDFSVNINPLGVLDSVKEAMVNGIEECIHYPDIESRLLRERIADHFPSISVEDILCGNGASELLMAIAHGLRPKKALLVAPGFSGYEYALSAIDCEIKRWYAKEEQNFSYGEDLCEAIMEVKPNLVIFANPSNPVGALMEPELLRKIMEICEEKKIYLVIDECFLELSGQSKRVGMASQIKDHKYLLILRAFTKSFAIPGIRLGYLFSSNERVRDLIRINLPEWNVSVIAGKAGIAAMQEFSHLEEAAIYVEKERDFFMTEFHKLGIKTYPSFGNYFLFYENQTGGRLKEQLLVKGILIRDCSDYPGLLKGYYRVAVKTHEENETLVQILNELFTP